MIGSLFIGNTNNLALMLVEEGLASVHVTCGDRTLQQAEKVAKEKKIGVRIIAYRILKLLSAFSQNVYET